MLAFITEHIGEVCTVTRIASFLGIVTCDRANLPAWGFPKRKLVGLILQKQTYASLELSRTAVKFHTYTFNDYT